MATYEEFRKLELKAAVIKKVHEIEGANKLYRLIIDVGDKQKQIISSKFCLGCFGCCRFACAASIWAPFGIKPIKSQDLKKTGSDFVCPHLNVLTNKCKIYPMRPLDCKIYPFVLTKKNNHAYLALHKNCLFIEDNLVNLDLKCYVNEAIKYLDASRVKNFIKQHPDFIKQYQRSGLIFLKRLKLYDKFC